MLMQGASTLNIIINLSWPQLRGSTDITVRISELSVRRNSFMLFLFHFSDLNITYLIGEIQKFNIYGALYQLQEWS